MNSNLNRHMAQCKICQSPYREDFEENFIRWSTVRDWQEDYRFDKYTVYRHAKAYGLLEKRRTNSVAALEHFVDSRCYATSIKVSEVISAIKLIAELEEKKQKRLEAEAAKLGRTSETMGESAIPAPESGDAIDSTGSSVDIANGSSGGAEVETSNPNPVTETSPDLEPEPVEA